MTNLKNTTDKQPLLSRNMVYVMVLVAILAINIELALFRSWRNDAADQDVTAEEAGAAVVETEGTGEATVPVEEQTTAIAEDGSIDLTGVAGLETLDEAQRVTLENAITAWSGKHGCKPGTTIVAPMGVIEVVGAEKDGTTSHKQAAPDDKGSEERTTIVPSNTKAIVYLDVEGIEQRLMCCFDGTSTWTVIESGVTPEGVSAYEDTAE